MSASIAQPTAVQLGQPGAPNMSLPQQPAALLANAPMPGGQPQAGGVMGATGGVTAPAGAPPVGAIAPSYPLASLYVGDLHPDVTESMLFEKFSTAGPVLSIRVCRDAITRRSLGYAYVNFQQPADAERALDTMNFDMMNNKPIRIMWSQRDPSIRRSGAGNIFIKNLDKHIDTKSIYDTFSMFGSILSCKVACDLEGQSKGYGFIHFETEEAAQKAIDKVNGMLLDGKKVFVGKFQPRAARLREMGDQVQQFTNVYVKNFAEELDTDKLQELFSKFGQVLSCKVMSDPEGKSRGFGFVAYENFEEAEKAVEEMDGKELPGTELKLTVCRAQKKIERVAELKRRYDMHKTERMQRYQGVNLYVKNIDETVDDDALRKQFEQYGAISSAKVMCDEIGRSKGFGFVCFEKPDDATKAVVEMNNKMLGNKPLYVALAQRKEERKAQLATQYMQRLAAMRMQNPAMSGAMYGPAPGGFFIPGGLPANQRAAAQFMGGAAGQMAPMAQMRTGVAPRWNNIGGAGGAFNAMQAAAPYIMQTGQSGYGQMGGRPAMGGPRGMGMGGPMPAGGAMRQPYGASYPINQYPPGSGGGPAGMGMGRFGQQQGQQPQGGRMGPPAGMMGGQPQQMGGGGMRGQPMTGYSQMMSSGGGPMGAGYPTYGMTQQQPPQRGMMMPQQGGQQPMQQPPSMQNSGQQAGIVVQNQEPLTSQMLAAAQPQEQKQMLGERLYPLIQRICKDFDVGKITGMMLEMDNAELLMMLESDELLQAKVNEATSVLSTAKPQSS